MMINNLCEKMGLDQIKKEKKNIYGYYKQVL